MNKPSERDVMATQYALNRINARIAEDARNREKAAKHHARVEAFCAVASVLIVQGVAALFFFQAIK